MCAQKNIVVVVPTDSGRKDHQNSYKCCKIDSGLRCMEHECRAGRNVKCQGNVDTNPFSAEVESKPYGDEEITKLECVGRVHSRLTINKMWGKN